MRGAVLLLAAMLSACGGPRSPVTHMAVSDPTPAPLRENLQSNTAVFTGKLSVDDRTSLPVDGFLKIALLDDGETQPARTTGPIRGQIILTSGQDLPFAFRIMDFWPPSPAHNARLVAELYDDLGLLVGQGEKAVMLQPGTRDVGDVHLNRAAPKAAQPLIYHCGATRIGLQVYETEVLMLHAGRMHKLARDGATSRYAGLDGTTAVEINYSPTATTLVLNGQTQPPCEREQTVN